MKLIYHFTPIEELKKDFVWQEKFPSGVSKFIYLVDEDGFKEFLNFLKKNHKDNEFKHLAKLQTLKTNVGLKRFKKELQKYGFDKKIY